MTKKMRELQAKILEKTNAAQALLDGENKDIAKAEAMLNEVDELQKELDLCKKLEDSKKANLPETVKPVEATVTEKTDSIKALANAARAGFKNMNEGTPADGGYTVPEDIVTKVNAYKEERFSLAKLTDYEAVKTKSGRRTYKKRAQHTGFTEVAEGGKIGKTAKPQFEVINYNIKKYAGFLPVTNELLEDSDAAIAQTIIEWLGEEEIATENAQIIAAINKKTATAFNGLKDLKKAVNVTLAAFAGSVKVITNADGLQYLDTLEDSDGRSILKPNPAEPLAMSLAVGVRSIPLVVVPNDVLKTESNAIPFIVGDLKEYVKEFDRKQLTIDNSGVASIGDFNAYEQDMQLFRGIKRADWQVKDAAAIVRGTITPAAE